MLKYKLIEKGNPSNMEAPKKHYASLVNSGQKTLRDICKDIEDKSSLSRGDISNVLENLVDQIPKYLLDGHIVKLGELGSLRLSVSSEGCEDAKDFSASKIRNVKIIFTPGRDIKESLTKAKYEKM